MRHVAQEAEKNSLIIPDYTIINTFIYFQTVEHIAGELFIGTRPNVQGDFPTFRQITPDNISDILRAHTVYLTSILPQYVPGWILDNFHIQKQGILYQIVSPKKPQAQAAYKTFI